MAGLEFIGADFYRKVSVDEVAFPEDMMKLIGAIEGTRTPTPLRVHGPEPCASANSATMAIVIRLRATLASHRSGENHNNILQAHRWLSNIDGQASSVRSGLKIPIRQFQCSRDR